MANANNTGISSYHLAQNPQLYEPSRNNTFEFIVTGLSDLLPAGMSKFTATESDYFKETDIQDVIRLSVSEAFVPHFSITPVEIRRGNSVMKFAGAPSFDDGSIKCHDYVGARTKDVLLAWQACVYNVEDDVVNLASEYKRDCTLLEYAPDYSRVVRKWTLKGCWIKSLSENPFSHESHDAREIDVGLVYDRAIPEIPTTENA